MTANRPPSLHPRVLALTLTQPWATLVIEGIKQWETRAWHPTADAPFTIWIHASRKIDKHVFTEKPEIGRWLRGAGYNRFSDLPLGALLGTVTYLGSRPTEVVSGTITAQEITLGDYTPGRWAWAFGGPHKLPQVHPIKGSVGLWEISPLMLRALPKLLDAPAPAATERTAP